MTFSNYHVENFRCKEYKKILKHFKLLNLFNKTVNTSGFSLKMQVINFFYDEFMKFLFEYLKTNEARSVLTFKVLKKNKISKKFYWKFGNFGVFLKFKPGKFIKSNKILFFKNLKQTINNPKGILNVNKKLEKFFFL